jgi:hypothetical protein
MESAQSRTLAQVGGFLLLVSLVLPWFSISFGGLASQGFSIWKLEKSAGVLIAAYGLFAVSQVRLSSRDTMALIYMVLGGLMTAGLVYKLWIAPPGSSAISIGGQSIDVGEVLKQMGLGLKPTYGAFVAFAGSLMFTIGAFLEFRSGSADEPVQAQRWQAPAPVPGQPAPGQPLTGQRYVPPTQPAHPVHAPDPFAVPPQSQQQ